MVKTRNNSYWLVIGMMFASIALSNLGGAYQDSVDSNSFSFVYSYGDAKIWVLITLNRTLLIGQKTNGSISSTIYLEKLGNNTGVFINRLTFAFEGTQIRKIISPNMTLNNNLRSWTCNTTFTQEDIDQILLAGQTMVKTLNFEFRYDVIDSSGEYWFYRANENIPAKIQGSGQATEIWMPFGTVFLIVSLLGLLSAVVVLGLKIRSHKKAMSQNKKKIL